MVDLRILPMGERALLVETDSLEQVLWLHQQLQSTAPKGVSDLVPAARTVLVRVDTEVLSLHAARAWITDAQASDAPAKQAEPREVEIAIRYDGADLAHTAELMDVSPEHFVRAHQNATWRVAFTGFAPGFGYLVSPDWSFWVPRLDTPRTRVPAGSVGLAAEFTGAYPRDTPGGWQLIGTTSETLFDQDASPPALLAPGMRVRFVETLDAVTLNGAGIGLGTQTGAGVGSDTGANVEPIVDTETRTGTDVGSATDADFGGDADLDSGGTTDAHDRPLPPTPYEPAIEVLEPGILASIQDLGRPGVASLGVAASGATDRAALRTANRLVGNAEDAAALEIAMGGFRAVARRHLWFAVTGGWGSVRLAGREVDHFDAHEWPAGEELQMDWFEHGTRAYLAVRGGVDGREVYGSRATDSMAGIGPRPLESGDVLAVRDEVSAPIPAVEVAPWTPPNDHEVQVDLAPGPRSEWFTEHALGALFDTVWRASADGDRVGLRLEGPELARKNRDELPSEGMVPGAIQVSPDGRPTILLADGPVTGGYPVIAVVTAETLDALAQVRPGTRIRFRHAR